MNRYFAALAPLALLTASGCAAPFQANVSRFQQLPAPQGQTFAVVADDPRLAGGLEFSQYARIVEDRLAGYGYTRAVDPASANLIVRFDYGVDGGRERVRRVPGGGFGYGFGHRPLGFGYGWGGYRPFYGYGRRHWVYGWDDPFLYARASTMRSKATRCTNRACRCGSTGAAAAACSREPRRRARPTTI